MLVDPAMIGALKELRMDGMPDPVAEIVEVFREDGTQLLGLLVTACDEGDVHEVARLSHRFRGSCANLGCTAMIEVLQQLETQARDGHLDAGMRADVHGLPSTFTRTLQEIDRLL